MATIQKKSFWQQYGGLILILGGIAIGALIGAFAPSVGTTIKPIGDIFLNLLFTIVVPLVFVSIASAVGSMANMKRLGRILGSTVGTFIFTGLIAAACVLTWVNLFSPSAGASIQLTTGEVGEAQSAGELLVSSLTVSDFSDLWDKSNMLPLIIFAIIFGFCVSACGGDESPMGKLLNNLNDIIMKFVGVIMFIAPIGLGAYFANLVATYGSQIATDYARALVVYYPLCFIYIFVAFPCSPGSAAARERSRKCSGTSPNLPSLPWAPAPPWPPSPPTWKRRRPPVSPRMSARSWFLWAPPCTWMAPASLAF